MGPKDGHRKPGYGDLLGKYYKRSIFQSICIQNVLDLFMRKEKGEENEREN
jgi:hypothetical protein